MSSKAPLTVRGSIAPPLPADRRNRLRLIIRGRAGQPLWDRVCRVAGGESNEPVGEAHGTGARAAARALKVEPLAKKEGSDRGDEKTPEPLSAVNPCVWRDRWGNLRQALPSREAFAADVPPVLESYLTAGSGSRNRARYAEAGELAGKEMDFGVEVVPYRLKGDDGREISGATVRLTSLAPRHITSGGAGRGT